MNSIVYIVGAIVIIAAVLSFFGLANPVSGGDEPPAHPPRRGRRPRSATNRQRLLPPDILDI
jgi:hypothetical protein